MIAAAAAAVCIMLQADYKAIFQALALLCLISCVKRKSYCHIAAGEIDILDVFRKPSDIPPHLDDILAKNPLPKVVWLQSGITNPEAEEVLAKAGIKVVSDRCLKVDHQQAMMQSKM